MSGADRRGAHFRLRGVSVAFSGGPALQSVDLEVTPGEVVGLVGLSGAGKTTLLRLLNGTQRPSRGRVEVNGRDLSRLSRRELRQVRAGIGFVPQDLSLIPNVRVLHNVISGRLGRYSFWKGMRTLLKPSRQTTREVHQILTRVGIPEKLYQRTDRLSGGQRQRVAIARALFQRPAGLIADEPVSSVDPALARNAVQLLCRISRKEGLTLCVSLHNLPLAREFFPRLVGLSQGRVVFDRPSGQLGEADFQALYEMRGGVPNPVSRDRESSGRQRQTEAPAEGFAPCSAASPANSAGES